MAPSAKAAASSGSTGSATLPEGCSRGRTMVAVFTLARASGAEIVNVSRSSATVDADPKFAAVCRVSISPATRTCAAYPNRASPSIDCAKASRSSSGIFQNSSSCKSRRAAHAVVTSACAESRTVSIPIPETLAETTDSPCSATVLDRTVSWVSRCVLALSAPQEPGVLDEHTGTTAFVRLANNPADQPVDLVDTTAVMTPRLIGDRSRFEGVNRLRVPGSLV